MVVESVAGLSVLLSIDDPLASVLAVPLPNAADADPAEASGAALVADAGALGGAATGATVVPPKLFDPPPIVPPGGPKVAGIL